MADDTLSHPAFLHATSAPATAATLSLADLGVLPDWLGAQADLDRRFCGVAPLERAGPDDLAVFVAGRDPDDLALARAGGCFLTREDLGRVPAETIAIVTENPTAAFFRAALRFAAMGERTPVRLEGLHPSAVVANDVMMEAGVAIGPGAIVGAGVQIGAGTSIGAHCVIGDGVAIGRNCTIEDHVSIRRSLIGDRVRIHAGARLGVGTVCHNEEVPLGRLIVQDRVRIGANAALAHGVLGDTVIGEAASIGALVAVAADALVDRFDSIGCTSEMVSAAKMV